MTSGRKPMRVALYTKWSAAPRVQRLLNSIMRRYGEHDAACPQGLPTSHVSENCCTIALQRKPKFHYSRNKRELRKTIEHL